MDGIHLGADHLVEELTRKVSVGRDGGDSRFVDFLLRRVHTLTLVHSHIVVAQMLVGKGHDLCFGDTRHALEPAYDIEPVLPVDKGILHQLRARTVVEQRLVVVELEVVHHRWEKLVGEVTSLQLSYFAQHQVAHFFKTLPLFGHSLNDKLPIIGQRLGVGTGSQDFHGLLEVEVEEAGLAVGEHVGHHLHGVGLQTCATFKLPSHHHVLRFQSHDSGVCRSCEIGHRRIFRSGERCAFLPAAEILVNDVHHLFRIEVSGHADGHVVGHVVALEVVFDVDNRWVFQMLLCADGGLCAVWMGGEELLVECSPLLATVTGQSDVVLLVHGFKFGVEAADDHVLEPVALYLRPVVYLVVWNVFHVACHIVGSVGVGTLGSDTGHEFVILIGDVVAGGQLRNGVYLVVGLFALGRVGELAILLVARLYFVEERLFGGVVGGAELLRALKHQVLQIVGQTCGLCRIVA